MTIYILGVSIISFLYLAMYGKVIRFSSKSHRGELIWLYISISLIVFLWGMRGMTVGLDTKSYSVLYDWATDTPISQYDRYWIEPGYAILTMFCAQVLTLSYHNFVFLVSIFCGISLLRFIKRYSKNYYLSLISFVSFPLMSFYMSGLRNEIMISIMLLTLPLIEKKKAWRIVVYEFIIVLSSILIHKSGIICTLIPLFAYKRKYKHLILTYFVIPVFMFISKGAIYRYITSNFKDVGSAGNFNVGTTFFINICFLILIVFLSQSILKEDVYNGEFDINILSIRLIFWSIIGALISNGASDILSRMIIYFQMFFILGISNSFEISNQKRKTKNTVFFGIVIILFIYFYIFILLLDPYGIVPYVVYR